MDSLSPMRSCVRSIATAVPPHKVSQKTVLEFFQHFFNIPEARLGALERVYENSKIESRYLSAPPEWYYQPHHDFKEKNDLYIETSLDLLSRAATEAVSAADLEFGDIDMIVLVSSTGVAVPSLDARLTNLLPFRRNVQRLPVFGFGCGGGVTGLARAATFARTGKRVLFLIVELCTLTFCPNDRTKANVVSTALFGDGAVAAVLAHDSGPAVVSSGEHTWRNTVDVMGWDVTGRGLEVVLSRSIPGLVEDRMRDVTKQFLHSVGLTIEQVDEFVCHPGGAKVLDALEDALGLPAGGLWASREILRDYGNMSAVTVIFILKRILEAAKANGTSGRPMRRLLTSFGPGFTAAFLVLEG